MKKSDAPLETDENPRARPRGRPRAFDRAVALEQATRLFWSKGYEATSIADLTQAMGIGSPSLYAAFGSKEALYAEALRHYSTTNEGFAWGGFFAAATAREAVRSLLMDSAAALTGCVAGAPRGCMVTLAAIEEEEHPQLCAQLRAARTAMVDRLEMRFQTAVANGELASTADIRALARFIQSVQSGMSILARDGVSRVELESVADLAMAGWDAKAGSR